jgi:hypothetical protein
MGQLPPERIYKWGQTYGMRVKLLARKPFPLRVSKTL